MNKPTTDQQPVTVAQIDRQAAALIFPTHAMTIMSGGWDETENVQVFARHGLASVSSASAEPRKDTVAFVQEWMMSGDHEPDQWHRDFAAAIDARRPTEQSIFDAINEDCGTDAAAWIIARLAAAASPEPVPATNQAGEVEHGYVAYGPDGHWHWSSAFSVHESIEEQRPATLLEKRLLNAIRNTTETLHFERVTNNHGCKIPPEGWWCSREPGHEGPCAARETGTADTILTWYKTLSDTARQSLSLRDLHKLARLFAALATQPATSQEGGEPTCERCDRGVCVNPHYEDDDRLNRPAATPTPPTLNSWANTPEAEHERILLMAEIELHLKSCRIFLTSREKMHPVGVDIHDELLAKVTAAIEATGSEKAHG